MVWKSDGKFAFHVTPIKIEDLLPCELINYITSRNIFAQAIIYSTDVSILAIVMFK